MDNEYLPDYLLIEEEVNEDVENKDEEETIRKVIPMFLDLFEEFYDIWFIAQMIKKQYMLKTDVDDIRQMISGYNEIRN